MDDSFAIKLKQLRKTVKLTQVDLANKLGVSQVTIANYERGERFPKADILVAIAKIFKISLDELLVGGSEAEDREAPVREEMAYSLEELLNLLRNHSFEKALAYSTGWMRTGGFDLLDFYEQVLCPVLYTTGDLWMKGEILVSEEHLISRKVQNLIILLGNTAYESADAVIPNGKRWIGLCSPGEGHSLALLMMSQVLRLRGWETLYLGTHVPFHDLEGLIKLESPACLSLSVTMKDNIEGFSLYLDQLEKVISGHFSVILGGKGLKYLNRGLSDHFSKADTIRKGIALLEKV